MIRKYLFSLDYLRGFAAISVCLFHFTDKLDYLQINDPIKKIFSSGHFGVEIFFIISGLVIPYSMMKGNYTLRKLVTFLKKRFIRIEPPYLLCVALVLLLNYITTQTFFYKGNPFVIDHMQIFYHVGYLTAFMGKEWLNQIFWTLAIEFQYYLLIALIFPLISHKNNYILISTLVIFNALSLYVDRNIVFNFSIYFTTGILLYRYLAKKSGKIELFLSLCIVLVFLVMRYTYEEITVVLFTITIILIPLNPTPLSTFFGNISYSLYLLHMPVGLRLINLTQRFSDTELVRQGIVLVAFLLTVFVSYYYYRIIEKPFKKLSQKIKYEDHKEISATGTLTT